MVMSMTGFAARDSQLALSSGQWTVRWELRSVNGKGLDLRLRLPDWLPQVEAAAKARLSQDFARGSITLGLKLTRAGEVGAGLNDRALARVLDLVAQVASAAGERGVALHPPSALDLLRERGVLEAEDLEPEAVAELSEALLQDLAPLVASFAADRAAEGAALAAILSDQVNRIEDGAVAAEARAAERAKRQGERLAQSMKAIMGTISADPDRIAQELALLYVKSDITEEIDRLRAHVQAARTHLAGAGPMGRKLDFLCQEFNSETNTLCSKSGDAELTRIGLDLKHIVDQFREQVQNVE